MTSQTKNTASIEHSEEKEDPAEASSWTATAGSFGRWVLTPMGFAITVYGLNLIAWGGMLFLLLCNAAPAMCHPSCNDLYSSRRIWIEIDSQILNALFCVTGFGLAPWRIRDLYLWCRWRLGREAGTRRKWFDRLAEVHASWFYQRPDPNGTSLLTTTPDSPSEGRGATPTPRYKLHVVIWGNILNTGFQICLAACMWSMNRFNRPSWTTGLFVALACVAAGVPELLMWLEKKRIKKANEHPGPLLVIPRSILLDVKSHTARTGNDAAEAA
ncbi:hypothetical protein KXV92_000967 [Aspergillus fumigatus]|nr:hypothetical protein KXV32_004196 [Aspergillus fumigatus]KAH3014576.1 hypothetical protein KXW60_008161 [Aspergillus fumigatus]KAH3196377.1 hypothetical protein KXV92_000967 [Aspergillus fumigatus]